ncbi:MAG: hypothetical protein GY861_10755 [bacterium]|nr:hypothetical protein [bacterium]
MADNKKLVKAKKKWCQIVAPKVFESALLGESLIVDPEVLVGRVIGTNLAAVSGNMRHQSITLKFMIIGIENGKAQTELIYYEMMPAAIKRLVRRGTIRLDDSIICETSDGKLLKIKPMLLTRSKTSSSKITALRNAMIDLLSKEVKKNTYETLAIAMISAKLQIGLKQALKKVYPLKSCEIKKVELVKKKGTETVKFSDATKKKAPKEEKAEDAQKPEVSDTDKVEEKEEKAAEVKEEKAPKKEKEPKKTEAKEEKAEVKAPKEEKKPKKTEEVKAPKTEEPKAEPEPKK